MAFRHRRIKLPRLLATDRRRRDGGARVRRLVTVASVSTQAAYEPLRAPNIVESTEKSRRYASSFEPPRCPATQPATCAREVKSSLVRMCSRWLSTVRSDRNRRSAMARLVIPEATNLATSSSRLLRRPGLLAALPPRRAPGVSRANARTWLEDIVRPNCHALSATPSDRAARAAAIAGSSQIDHGSCTGVSTCSLSFDAAPNNVTDRRGWAVAPAAPMPSTCWATESASLSATRSSAAMKRRRAASVSPERNSNQPNVY